MNKKWISALVICCVLCVFMGSAYADTSAARELLISFTEKANRYPDVLDRVNAVYQLNLDNDQYQINIQNNTATFSDGTPWKAKCTFTISSENFAKLVSGELDATDAYFSGKLKLKGKISDARKLGNIIKEIKDLP